MQKLAEAVKTACDAMAKKGITGWGLTISDEIPGTIIQTAPAIGCTSETCSHISHDPAAPDYRWIPPDGSKLTFLGEDGKEGYFHLETPHEELFLCYTNGGYYHDWLSVVKPEEIPAYILADFPEKGKEGVK